MFELHRDRLSACGFELHLIKKKGVVLHRCVVIYHCTTTENISALGITSLFKLVSGLCSVPGGSRLTKRVIGKHLDVFLNESLSSVVRFCVPSIFLL